MFSFSLYISVAVYPILFRIHFWKTLSLKDANNSVEKQKILFLKYMSYILHGVMYTFRFTNKDKCLINVRDKNTFPNSD